MALQITMIKAPGGVEVSNEAHTFSGAGGTIGRGESNLLVLKDPDRFLSSRHCEILCDAGHTYIVDLSTNGTFVNGSAEPLGKGSRAPLKDGDTFEVGDYMFRVSVAAGAGATPSSPFDDVFDTEPGGGSLDDFLTPAEPVPPASDPFASSGYAGGFPQSPESESLDPLALLDRATQQNDIADPFSPLIPESGSSEAFAGGTFGDSGDALNQSISWPQAASQNLIPEEWEEELGVKTPEPEDSQPSVAASRPPVEPAQQRATAEPVPPRQSAPQPSIDSPVPAPGRTPAAAERPNPTAVIPSVRVPTERTDPISPDETSPQEGQAPKSNNRSKATESTSNSLLEAMGLDANALPPEQVEEIVEEVGLLMREVVGGMMQVLRSRSSIKNEFRMNVTTIQPVENNPLKFSVDVDEAMANMFVRRSKAYKKPVEAVREGFQEIGEHQLAVIAGIRHGFEQMMKRFDPEIMEQNFDRQGSSGILPGMKKAKYWSNYRQHFVHLMDNMEHSFQHLFGSDFVHAYEDQLRRLKVARKHSPDN